MPCSKCGGPLYGFVGEKKTLCKNCDKTKFLSYEESIKFCDVSIELAKKYFYNDLKKYNPKALMLYLLNYREKLSYDFLMKTHYLPEEEFLAVNTLLKKLPRIENVKASTDISEEKVRDLVNAYLFYTSFENWKIHVQEGLALFLYDQKINLDEIEIDYLMTHSKEFLDFCKNFTIVYNENFEFIFESFKSAQHLSEKEVEQYMKKHAKEYEEVERKSLYSHRKNYSSKEYIESLYDMLIGLYVGLLRNHVYAEVFNIEYLKKTSITPQKIIKLRNIFPHKDGLLSVTTNDEFIQMIEKLGYSKEEIFDNMVFSFTNNQIFPFLVKLNGNIICSYWLMYLMYMFSYLFLEFETFQSVHEEKSRVFEQEVVKREFEKIGFDYKPNQKPRKKGFEIDGLAQKDRVLLIVEVKHWIIKRYFEQMKIHSYRERDLKGVVDGKQYTTKDGEQIEEDKPSLLEKIEYVKNNLEMWSYDKIAGLQIKGIVITKSYPPIKEYKGILFLSVNEIKNLPHLL